MKIHVHRAEIERFNFERGKFEKYIQYFAEYKIGRATFTPAFGTMGELRKWAKANKYTVAKNT